MHAHEQRGGKDPARTPAPFAERSRVTGLTALQRAAGNAGLTRAIENHGHAHDAEVGHAPGAQSAALLNVLRSGGHSAAAPALAVQRVRAPNPNAQASPRQYTLTAHHVIPHQLLHRYLPQPGITKHFVPDKKQVTLGQLSNLNLIPKLDKVDMGQGETASGGLSAQSVVDDDTVPSVTREKIRIAVEKVAATKKDPTGGKDDESGEGIEIREINEAFFMWAPANIFYGPEPRLRDWDPGSGMDKDAQYFLDPEHHALLLSLHSAIMRDKNESTKRPSEEVRRLFSELVKNHNKVTPHDPERWVPYEAGGKTKYHPQGRVQK